MMIEFHDPRGEVAVEAEPYTLSHSMAADGGGTTLGLLANGFPDSEAFLAKLAEVLQQRFPRLQVAAWNKGNASIPAPAEMLEEIQARCQIAVAAYGH